MKIKLTENKLKQIITESVRNILSEARKPSDRTVGKHTLKGLRYDKSGNPLYTSDTMSDDEKKNQGWKFSKKHGMYGQLSDPTKLSEGVSREFTSEEKILYLTQVIRRLNHLFHNDLPKSVSNWTEEFHKVLNEIGYTLEDANNLLDMGNNEYTDRSKYLESPSEFFKKQ